MIDIGEAVGDAAWLIISLDSALFEIVALSLIVSFSATALAAAIGLPLGAALAMLRFPGRKALVALTSAFMALPPVVVGLVVYLLLSRSGPLGVLGLLYTPTAMIIAQTILVLPIIAALARQTLEALHHEYDELFRAMRVARWRAAGALLWDGRFALSTAVLAGLGRALAEVGAVMIVGGNINHATRVMTTAIALETSKGALAEALGLGLILLTLSLAISGAAVTLRAAVEDADPIRRGAVDA